MLLLFIFKSSKTLSYKKTSIGLQAVSDKQMKKVWLEVFFDFLYSFVWLEVLV